MGSLLTDILSRTACGAQMNDLTFFYSHSQGNPKYLLRRLSDIKGIYKEVFPSIEAPELLKRGFDPPVCLDANIVVPRKTWERMGGIFYEASSSLRENKTKIEFQNLSIIDGLKLVPSMSKPWLDLCKGSLSEEVDKIDKEEFLSTCQSAFRWFSIREEMLIRSKRIYPEIEDYLSSEVSYIGSVLRSIDSVAEVVGFSKSEIENPFNRIAIVLGQANCKEDFERAFNFEKYLTPVDSEFVHKTLRRTMNNVQIRRSMKSCESKHLLKALIPHTNQSAFRRYVDVGRSYSIEQMALVLGREFIAMYRRPYKWPRNR